MCIPFYYRISLQGTILVCSATDKYSSSLLLEEERKAVVVKKELKLSNMLKAAQVFIFLPPCVVVLVHFSCSYLHWSRILSQRIPSLIGRTIVIWAPSTAFPSPLFVISSICLIRCMSSLRSAFLFFSLSFCNILLSDLVPLARNATLSAEHREFFWGLFCY